MVLNKKIEVPGFVVLLGALLGIIWTCIQIYDFIQTLSDYRVSAEGHFTSFIFPSNSVFEIINNDDKNSTPSAMTTPTSAPTRNKGEVTLRRVLTDEYTYWNFKVKNEGNNELKQLTLDLPFSGYYSMDANGRKTPARKFAYTVQIGDLRPSNSTSVDIWSEDVSSRIAGGKLDFEPSVKDISLTHEKGIAKIKYPNSKKGPPDLSAVLNASLIALTAVFGVASSLLLKTTKMSKKNSLLITMRSSFTYYL